MKWELHKPEPKVPFRVLEIGGVRLTISDACDDPTQRWQYLSFTVGRHTRDSMDQCMEKWPREALAHAQAALDEFEAALAEDE